ncbi:MAG TPA: hypothetical protein VJQ77_09565 [Novosphingobium sp.]|nr:hypothetical protein [Novosphingobium sp.]
MYRICFVIAITGILAAGEAQARPVDRPITENEPDVMDIAKTPTTDLNITKEEIPPALIAAVQNPYDLSGLGKCPQLAAAVQELDSILGPDFDLPQEARERVSPGRVAKWVVSSLIPFRGLIRELSGANAQERAVQAAIQAGLARRGFLKGLGAARRCQYPAGPATPEVVKAHLAQNSDDDGANDKRPETGPAEERTKSGIRIVSEPVVQPLP